MLQQNTKTDFSITGEFWSREAPEAYSLKYFEFKPATGGGIGFVDADLQFNFVAQDIDSFINSVLTIQKQYPFVAVSFTDGSPVETRMSIFSQAYYDFHFLFAIAVENIISNFVQVNKLKLLPRRTKWGKIRNTNWGETTYHHSAVNFQLVRLTEKGINWVYSAPDKNGIEKCRIRIDMHHPDVPNERDFFHSLKKLLELCNIEYLEYKMVSKNFMLFIGNGRQGINGAPPTLSNTVLFKEKILNLLNEFNFVLGFNPEWTGFGVEDSGKNYSSLVNQESIILKDDRAKIT